MRINQFRYSFPILENQVYLATCAHGAQATQVRNRLIRYLDDWNEHGQCWNQQWKIEYEILKTRMAELLNCEISELAHSFSASVLLGSLISSMPFSKERKKIVTTDIEFAGIGQQWIAQRDLENIEVVFLRSNEENEISINQFEEAIDETTLLVSVTHVNYENGCKLDIEPIIEVAHKKGAMVLVDSYQAVGVEPIDVKALNVDFWIGGCSKYLLGTPGSVFLYAKREISDRLNPSIIGWHSQEEPNFFHPEYSLRFASGTQRFESGTRAVPCIYASNAGINLILNVGLEAITKRVQTLTTYFIEETRKLGLNVRTPLNPLKRGPMVAIEFQDPLKTENDLRQKNIISAARGRGVRFAFHGYNNEGDIEKTIEVLKTLI
ncbi:aminotransferase class V-fold PLP-dependent enzyme [Neobacillus vireti]|uniref:Class V aminotransferase n=1 Tax=Neobacillus vireti LMG 21834 TaxID=1131730 RepID=A0AB94IFI2_9BACI|nr:aminotransferase class V-fold PLP-dependent enzyme [Neobacillus vireti]ETI65870.1 class V aminotransferase [Neobacillus vireti LMG 21834]KLT17495.1 hypothetical protein AA980_12795 [Neobacillus vireti]